MTSNNSTKRGRVLGLQKERLVELVENYFIRKVGRNFEVHGIQIDKSDWESFANILNSVGPPKAAHEWKTSFNTMKSRVRTKMAAVLESGGTADANLSVVDQKIYFMYPHKTSNVDVEYVTLTSTENGQSLDEAQIEVELDGTSATSLIDIGVTQTSSDGKEPLNMPDASLDSEGATAPNDSTVHEEQQLDVEVNDRQNASLIHWLEVFVADAEAGSSVDESLWEVLAEHLNTLGPSLDVSDWQMVHRLYSSFAVIIDVFNSSKANSILRNGGNPHHYLSSQELRIYKILPFICYKYASRDGVRESEPNSRTVDDNGTTGVVSIGDAEMIEEAFDCETTDTAQGFNREMLVNELDREMLSSVNGMDRENEPEETEIDCMDSLDIDPVVEESEKPDNNQQHKKHGRPITQNKKRIGPLLSREVSTTKNYKKNIVIEPSGSQNIGVDKNFAKEFKRVTEVQKERLMQLVQNNFLKTVGRFSGPNGVAIKKVLWEKFARELNTLGPTKSVKQWKDCLDHMKGQAKMKLAINRSNDNEYGRGRKTLTRLEEKLVSVYGIENLDGQQGLGECGFNYNETMVSRSQNSISNEISEERRSTPTLLSLKRQKKAKEATGRNSKSTETNNVSEGQDVRTRAERSNTSGIVGAKRRRITTDAASVNEDSDVDSPTPTMRDQCVQSGKGNCGRMRNKFTSYEMVERSITAQERFIEDSNKNHAEMVHLFTTAVNAFARSVTSLTDVLRDALNN